MITIPNGYRRVTSLEEMQCLLYELMQELHNICEKHGLIYNIWGGSLLGAVRHKNIIPWDDDFDISMPRPDYEKLIQIVQEHYSDQFKIYTYPMDNYVYPFAKFCLKDSLLIEHVYSKQYSLLKLYIDIFPMDGVPESTNKEINRRLRMANRYRKYTSYCTIKIEASKVWWKKPFVVLKYIYAAVLKLWGYKYFLRKQIEVSEKYCFEDCDRVAFVSVWGGNERGILKREDHLNRKMYQMGKYEFWGPKNAHEWLKSWYGDYMTPPPENKRVPIHNYELYVAENVEIKQKRK